MEKGIDLEKFVLKFSFFKSEGGGGASIIHLFEPVPVGAHAAKLWVHMSN